ncbi:MAG: hypothetical protein LUE93_16185 [Bacteroides sp.]|nr:hypothetical protein [Bacteroides sp.]
MKQINLCKLMMLALLCGSPFLRVNSRSGTQQILNVHDRATISLDGKWQIIIDPMETGYYDYRYEPKSDGFFENRKVADQTELLEYDFDAGSTLNVPGDWNSQMPELLWYEGTIWYKRDFTYRKKAGQRVFLHFGAVNYEAKVYVNGRKVGEHLGGFTPFSFDITGEVTEGNNFIVVKVDNTCKREAIPTINSDWWNFGGITRSVNLVEVPQTFIQDYFIQLAKGQNDKVEGYIRLAGMDTGEEVKVTIPELKFNQTFPTDGSGYATISFPLKPVLWSPENPKLYDVTVSAGSHQITDRIGFRTIETRGQDILSMVNLFS